MTIASGTIQNVSSGTREAGGKYTSAGAAVDTCIVAVAFSGNYTQGDNAQVLDIAPAIQSSRRQGAVTILQAMMEYPGLEEGVVIGAKSVAVSGAGITCELTSGNLTTEHDTAALARMVSPIGFRVLYTCTV